MAVRFFISMVVLSLSAVAFAHGSAVHEVVRMTVEIYKGVAVVINGNELEEPGFIYNDRTYLPVRAVTEAMGATVEYDSTTRTVRVHAAPAGSALFDPSAQAQQALTLADIRKATAKYLDIEKAKSDGFSQASGMIPNHGYHFVKTLNILSTFSLDKPAGLVYIKNGDVWQLVAVEYTAILKPSRPLLPGGQWIQHEAACHYMDGNEILESNLFRCPRNHPTTGSQYTSWHPSAWTFHVWAWYPNPLGLYAGENPLLIPYNIPGVDIKHNHGSP